MRLLILTQKVDKNDDVLGFFHSWIEEFSKQYEKITVVCLQKGDYYFPSNVSVLSLGKETGVSRLKYLWHFFYFIFHERENYDHIFVHMNPEYVVLGGDVWRPLRKKISLWYVHRQVNLKLRIAERLAHIIFSTTPEAFRLKSKKVNFLGHGIDFSLFSCKNNLSTSDLPAQAGVDRFKIVHVGRITPIKNLDIRIESAAILKREQDTKFEIKLAGAPLTEGDIVHEKKLKELVRKLNLQDEVFFLGKVSFARIGELYRDADISVNLTPTGGMDKAVLESIASGTIALSANKAFQNLFGEYANYLLYNERDAEDVARKIENLSSMDDAMRHKIQEYLYARIREKFDLKNIITRIVTLPKKT